MLKKLKAVMNPMVNSLVSKKIKKNKELALKFVKTFHLFPLRSNNWLNLYFKSKTLKVDRLILAR